MNESITLFTTMPTTAVDEKNITSETAVIELFDPPMCCPTGLCGPSLDQTLLNVSEMIMTLQAEGTTVERYQMTSHPQKFMQNNDVMRLVREQQMAALPITAVRGQVIKTGAYPTLEELRAALNDSVTP
ncbi:MAG: arsenite efflux transporter metallochaperone ArsD [Candidatus Promineifilaceae bacterium]